ncbi:MAG: formate dehydrogenase subunit gamma [Rhodospirillales bacterium]|nr:MAG: formate dehydrogenase subunit gamma [Rhodospirillales bacterium]
MTRTFVWILLLAGFLAGPLSVIAPLPPLASPVIAAEGAPPGESLGNESDADLWRRVRRGESFMLSDPRLGAAVLVQSEGEEWRSIRNGPVSRYGGILVLVGLGAVILFALLRGKVKIEGGRTGRRIPRFTMLERSIHWFVAAVFILLAISGLIILFGRYILLPVIGPSAFGAVASAAMQGHNLFGPLFIVGLLVMLFAYALDNIFQAADAKWIIKGGNLFGGHAPSWKYNFGEKTYFWLVVMTGLVLSVTGILMEFPGLVDTMWYLQVSTIVHATAALLVIPVAMGHIYLGSIGVEGALEGMTEGTVDENWAREHHDLWAEKVMREMAEDEPKGAAKPAPGAAE